MNNILNKKYLCRDNINNKKNLFILFWIFCFIPINTNPENIQNFGSMEQIRLLIPFTLVLFYSLFLFRSENFITKDFFPTIFFIANIVLIIIFTIINDKHNTYINIYWGFAMLIPCLYLFVLKNKLDLLKLFLIFSLILVFFVFFFYICKMIYDMLIFGRFISLYSMWGLNTEDLFSLTNEPPRSSGLSRMAMVIAISSTLFLLFEKKNSFFLKIIILIIIIASSTFGLLFQSRTMIFIYFFMNIIIAIMLVFKKNLKKKFFLLIILLPLFLSILYNNFVFHNSLNQNLEKKNYSYFKFQDIKIKETFLRKTEEENFSSNRFQNWTKIISASNKNYFWGFGFQADRLIIKQSIHNVYLYSLICGGFISLLLITFISLRGGWTSFFILYKYMFLNKRFDPVDLISTFIIIIFLLRGLLETSYGVYSIDYLLFIISFYINELNYKKFTHKKL
jgi:hypothetical protein